MDARGTVVWRTAGCRLDRPAAGFPSVSASRMAVTGLQKVSVPPRRYPRTGLSKSTGPSADVPLRALLRDGRYRSDRAGTVSFACHRSIVTT
jgi:hypothetical protein